MPDIVKLKIDGEIHDGWQNIDIALAIDALAPEFNLTVKSGRKIPAGAACELWIDDEKIITGYVDSIGGQIDANGRDLRISGRAKTADLIDCSAINTPPNWKNQKLEAIAKALVAPFGLNVVVKADTGASFASFTLEQGESPFESITRMARLRGLIIGTDSAANVVIFSPNPTPANYSFIVGENVPQLSFGDDYKDRFSQYLIKGQHSFSGNIAAKDAAHAKALATDAGVVRYRPKLIVSDEQSTIIGLQKRAAFEATKAKANGFSVTVTMPSWRSTDGQLYHLGDLVLVQDEGFSINQNLMISDVRFSQSETSRACEITLIPPESLTPEPLPDEKKQVKKRGLKHK